ncbi:MAG: ferrochelatase [Proteobacteria bacterium]|nr:ferrochelatase [Pseudomonadota bacterium]
MGGPRSSDEVKPFLKAMFRDPDLIHMPFKSVLAPLIVTLRAPKARKHYAQIDGGSPLLTITQDQARNLEQILNKDKRVQFKVLVGMRYTSPLISDALSAIANIKCQKIIALSMYPQYCSATTGSSIAELKRVAAQHSDLPPLRIIDRYFDRPAYLDALTVTVQAAIEKTQKNPFVLFSAHGVPVRMVQKGDPYVAETEATVSGVAERLNLPIDRWRLGFQSRVGPVRWVGPSSEQVIDELKDRSFEDLVIVPVSFTADNLETLYDIEIILAQKARAAGIPNVIRAHALNADPMFIGALADLVRGVAGG